MPRIKDEEQFEKYQFENLLGSTDSNPYFSKYYDSTVDEEDDSSRISEELLVSIPLENLSVSSNLKKEDPEAADKKKKPRRKRVYKKFSDRYKVTDEVLGRGSRSHVVVAVHTKTNKRYAVKVIDKKPGYDRSSTLREIDLLHISKSHPNILTLVESYEENENFFLVFEEMLGGPLLQHIHANERFTEKEASLVVKDIANALNFLHNKGIAHRDLKPENILCQYQDRIVPVKICDFDLASGIDCLGCATPELFTPVGSAEFMAPEVIEAFQGDAPAYDKRCDLWSLGVILYIMLSGKPPFIGKCGAACDWENGGSCYECQRMLWNNIKEGTFDFPEKDWNHISKQAKDLVSKLLVRDASKRLTADEVLKHKWILEAAAEVNLKTPTVLSFSKTNDEFNPFDLMSTEVLVYSRIMSFETKTDDANSFTDVINEGSWPKTGFGLSPPGKSSLARRRAEHLKRKEEKLKETRFAEAPIEASPVTMQNFVKVSSPVSKNYTDT